MLKEIFKIDDFVLWLAGLLFAGTGLLSVSSSEFLGGFFGLLAGITLLPAFHRLINRKLNHELPQPIFLVAAAVLFVIGGSLRGIDSGVTEVLASTENRTATDSSTPHTSDNNTPNQHMDTSGQNGDSAERDRKQEGDAAMAQIRQKMHSAEKSAHAPLYNRHQARPILERIGRTDEDARDMYQWALSRAIRDPDCTEIFKAEINPNSTSSNIIITVICANRIKIAINETASPSSML